MSTINVFVYGSLMTDEVVQILLNRVPQSIYATLNSYQRFSVKERVYPAIIPVETKKINGKVLLGVTVPELDILDTFEDIEYKRKTVEVSLTDSGEKLQAETYVWGDHNDPNLYGEWNLEEWKQLHMKDFLKMTKEFMEEQKLPESKTGVTTYESFFSKGDTFIKSENSLSLFGYEENLKRVP